MVFVIMRAKEGAFEAVSAPNGPRTKPTRKNVHSLRDSLRRQYGKGSAVIAECMRTVVMTPTLVARKHTDATVFV